MGLVVGFWGVLLICIGICVYSLGIWEKILVWEGCREVLLRMSMCGEKWEGFGGEWVVSEDCFSLGCFSVVLFFCSLEKIFDFKGFWRMSRIFFECFYLEIEEEGEVFFVWDFFYWLEKWLGWSEFSVFFRGYGSRKESLVVLSWI